MRAVKKHRLAIVTIVYWLLLLYMLAALLFWFIELNNQNKKMTAFRMAGLKKDDTAYVFKAERINEAEQLKTAQYLGEGLSFLAVILVGAVFVFRTTRRQLKLSQQEQNFMMAVTHELKTPIAVTRLNLETLQKRKLDEAKQQKLIASTLQEANRLNTLCNNILLASQLDGGVYLPVRQELNLSQLLEDSLADFHVRYPARRIVGDIEAGIFTEGEKVLLEMLVSNLVDNALKYSPADSPVYISLHQHGGRITLRVKDEGIGIAEEERKKIFEKFYRTGDENTRRTKGTGLGLYLCRRIMKGYGSVHVEANHPAGSVFTVIFNRS